MDRLYDPPKEVSLRPIISFWPDLSGSRGERGRGSVYERCVNLRGGFFCFKEKII